MTLSEVPAVLLHQIEQELDQDEKETMLFLCRDLVPDLTTPDVRKLLVALSDREKLTPFSLSELLYRMKRFDLLKKVLRTGRTAVEDYLGQYPWMVSRYRVLMAEIGDNLDRKDLSSIVFLLRSDLGTSYKKMPKEKSFLEVVTDLEKLDLVSPNQLDLIENCLLNIHRKDLVKKIRKYKQDAPVPAIGSLPPYANTFQASLSKLSLADPPAVVNKGRLQNGQSYPIQTELVHTSVPETGAAVVQTPGQYRMQSHPLGICLIVDCIGNAAGMLAETFSALRFKVHCHPFLSMSSLAHKLNEVGRLKEHRDYDCFVCVLVSRGSYQSICCTDCAGPMFPLERVKSYFTGDVCPSLLGKPKLFFVQNYIVPHLCWEDDASQLEVDGNPCTLPQLADILWSQSVVNASTLERSPTSSSYYLSTLAELLIDSYKRKQQPLLDVLVELNNRVYERNRTHPAEQYSLSFHHTLRKKLFLADNSGGLPPHGSVSHRRTCLDGNSES